MRDENPSPTSGGELVRRPEGEAEGAKRMSTSLSLRHGLCKVHGSPELDVVQGARNHAPCKVHGWQARKFATRILLETSKL